MSRAEQAAVLAAKLRAMADRRAIVCKVPSGHSIRDAQADALAELAELVSWLTDQLEPIE